MIRRRTRATTRRLGSQIATSRPAVSLDAMKAGSPSKVFIEDGLRRSTVATAPYGNRPVCYRRGMGFTPCFFRHAAVAFLLGGAGCAEPDPAGGVAAAAVRGEAEGEVEDVPYVGYLGGWSVTAGRPVFVDEDHIQGSA